MVLSRLRKQVRTGLALAFALTLGTLFTQSADAQAGCPDVEVLFARGSGELPGLGIVGGPTVNAIRRGLPGKNVAVWAVQYAAAVTQTSAGPGATSLTNHLVATAQRCQNTKFVLGGYSQGASVVDIALGIPNFLGVGRAIPAEYHARIGAVVLFGNPLALTGGRVSTNRTWGSRTREFCNFGDPVCGAGFNVMAHITYGFDGSAAQGGAFAAQKIAQGGR